MRCCSIKSPRHEKVEVSDAEVDEEIGKMAEYYRATPEEIRESLEKQGGA